MYDNQRRVWLGTEPALAVVKREVKMGAERFNMDVSRTAVPGAVPSRSSFSDTVMCAGSSAA